MMGAPFKLLIVNNLSVLVKDVLKTNFPDSRHVADFQMSSANDTEIWELAGEESFILLTKDKDFYHRIGVFGPPPKVILITKGNCRNKEMLKLIRDHLDVIEDFAKSLKGLLVIG